MNKEIVEGMHEQNNEQIKKKLILKWFDWEE